MASSPGPLSPLRNVENATDPVCGQGREGKKRLATIPESPGANQAPSAPRLAWAATGKENISDDNGALAPALASIRARIDTLRQHAEMKANGDASPGRPNPGSIQTAISELVEEASFRTRMDHALHAKLTSTTEGATKDTRIRELAEMVKAGRKALREALGRMEQLGNVALAFERDAALVAAESVAPHADRDAPGDAAPVSESQSAAHAKMLQAEVLRAQAEAKRIQAQAAAQVDRLEGALRSAEREVERFQEEKRLAEEFQRKAEAKACKAEAEVRQMKKECRDAVRAAEAETDALHKQLAEANRVHERERDALSARASAAEERVGDLEKRLAALQSDSSELARARAEAEGDLDAARAAQRKLESAHEELARECEALGRELGSAREREGRLTKEVQEARREAAELRARLEVAEAGKGAAEARGEAERGRLVAEVTRLTEEVRRLSGLADEEARRADRAEGERRELAETKERLKQALQEASGELVVVGEQLAQAGRTEAELRGRINDLEGQIRQERAEKEDAELRAQQAADASAEAMAELEGTKKRARDAEQKLETIECELETLKEVAGGDGDQRDMLNRLVAKVGQLEAAAAENEAQRRALQNEVISLKGNIRVFCRVRPTQGPGSVECLPDRNSLVVSQGGKDHLFSYDRVFGPGTSQEEVFGEVSELVQSALDGHKVCLFSYGQTGAGKTHTMQGNPSSPTNRGIIPRAVDKILECASRMERQGWQYTFEASYIEIYNEQLRDLLGKRGQNRIDEKNPIKHNDEGGHTVVQGATREAIGNYQDAQDIIKRANAARATEATAMNAVSSRSHSVFMMFITGYHEASQTRLTGALNLVDLAGSERLDRSQVEGARAKEAISINKSLASLGDVFAALGARQSHIPYRNSKLTHLLQPCLGGDGKTLMFVNINPELPSAQESVCSLRFAARVNQCETAARGGAKRNISLAGEEGDRPKAGARPGTAPATRAKRLRPN